MADNLTSLLINRQVPEFVREEHPLFITFLEAYYEYLEQKQGTQINDLTTRAKELRYISDVDDSIDDFEINFFNNYASLLPRDVEVDKATLIKNVLPLYLSKGSEASFKLLYRFMFGQELEVTYPKNDILRASDGKWEIENALKVSSEFFSYYTANGTNKEFKILQALDASDITVYVNNVLQSSGYHVRKESKKVVFDTAPTNGAAVKVQYSTALDKTIFTNRKITAETTGATALIERVASRILIGESISEFFINDKTLLGTFQNGENILTDVLVDDVLVNVIVATVSNVLRINVIDGGANYNVGDPVIINAPIAEIAPSAVISKVFSGFINNVAITDGGAGFEVGSLISALGYSNTQLSFAIAGVDLTGANTSNVFRIYSDVITDIDPANTVINVANYNFPNTNISPSGIVNVNSVISTAFANVSYLSIGEISNITILAATVAVANTPILNADPAIVTISPLTANTTNNTVVRIDTFGSLGKLVVTTPGSGYAVFDELVFTNKPMSFGTGAEAIISTVDGLGGITKAEFVPSKITGTANVSSVSNVMVHGIGTAFDTELVPGDEIRIGYDTRKVLTIASSTSLNVTSASWTQIYLGAPVRKIGKNLLGGQGYTQDKLPTVTINSVGGSGATINVTTIMGDGENLLAQSTKRPGEIEEIEVTNPGKAIQAVPTINLTSSGDQTATANATLTASYESLEGRFLTSDSILSSVDRKVQGRDFYVNYSYLLSSATEFSKYKKVFKDLLHPAGFKAYAELKRLNELDPTPVTSQSLFLNSTTRTVSGLVNVANASIFVTGTNTKFNVASSLGILTIGSSIAVNSEIRVVSSIISNTNLAVTSAFTITANNEVLSVLDVTYTGLETETTGEEITDENNVSLAIEP
jgi:hypothetical protein